MDFADFPNSVVISSLLICPGAVVVSLMASVKFFITTATVCSLSTRTPRRQNHPNVLCGKKHYKTRMHSSGMRTAHLLTVSQHALWRGDGVFVEGDVCPGVSASGPGEGVFSSGPRGECLSLVMGECRPLVLGGVSQHGMGQTPPPPRGQTDTCENITFANFICGW